MAKEIVVFQRTVGPDGVPHYSYNLTSRNWGAAMQTIDDLLDCLAVDLDFNPSDPDLQKLKGALHD